MKIAESYREEVGVITLYLDGIKVTGEAPSGVDDHTLNIHLLPFKQTIDKQHSEKCHFSRVA